MRTPLLRLKDYFHLVWCPHRAKLALALLVPLLAGCATRGTVAQTQNVNADGSVSAGVRSASDAQPGVLGPQEIAGIALPLGPITIKAAAVWDGQPWFWTPPAPAAPAAQAAPQCAPMFMEVTEEYEELVPVRKTRTRQVEVAPVPQRVIPRCAPAVQAAPRCSCVDGKCGVTPAFVVADAR